MKSYLQGSAAAVLVLILTLQCVLLQTMIIFEGSLLRSDYYDVVLSRSAAYGQMRQFILKAAQEHLRFGSTGMPYLESVLTEAFLREEFLEVIAGVEAFLKGKASELPVIPVYRLKNKVADAVIQGGRKEEADALVQYWFDPLTNEVRFAYFTGIEFFHRLRYFIARRFLLLILSAAFSTGLFFLYVRLRHSFWEGCLCLGSALVASGGLLTGIGMVFLYTVGYGAVQKAAAGWTVQYGIPDVVLPSLMRSAAGGISLILFAAALVSAVLGGLIIQFVPIKDL